MRSNRYVPKQLSARIRAAVKERDGHKCACCGATTFLAVDHIVPASLGGSDDLENLQTLCRGCNTKKGKKDHCPCRDADYVPSATTVFHALKMQRRAGRTPVQHLPNPAHDTFTEPIETEEEIERVPLDD